jgi:hypothetical protein
MVAMAASALIPDLSSRPFEDNYVYVQDPAKDLTYTELQSFLANDSQAFINTSSSVSLGVIDPLEDNRNLLSVNSTNDLVDHAKGRMLLGRRPNADNEIMITRAIADLIIKGVGAEYGITSYRHLLVEKYRLGQMEVRLTGIIDSDVRVTYTSRHLMNAIHKASITTNLLNYEVYGSMTKDLVEITHGAVPVGNQVLVSKAYFETVFNTPLATATFPINDTFSGYVVAGVFDSDLAIVIAGDAKVEELRFNRAGTYYVYTKDTDELVKDISPQVVRTYDVIDQIRKDFIQNSVELRVAMNSITLVVIGFTFLGFYFVMRSSMVSRIYEIAVYRALGMKKSELMISFLVEVLILTTVTSLIGYGVSVYALSLADDTFIGMFRLFVVSPISVFVGILLVYGINLLGGMMPIFMLLRKTPAQILAQYDI